MSTKEAIPVGAIADLQRKVDALTGVAESLLETARALHEEIQDLKEATRDGADSKR